MAKQTKTLAKEITRLRAKAKACYERADELLDELVKRAAVGQRFPLGNGQEAVLMDNFDGTNKSWKATCVSRYDIRVKATAISASMKAE